MTFKIYTCDFSRKEILNEGRFFYCRNGFLFDVIKDGRLPCDIKMSNDDAFMAQIGIEGSFEVLVGFFTESDKIMFKLKFF